MEKFKKFGIGFCVGSAAVLAYNGYLAKKDEQFTVLYQTSEDGMPVLYVRKNWSLGSMGPYKHRTPYIERYALYSWCKKREDGERTH